jgi:hypothetical protein
VSTVPGVSDTNAPAEALANPTWTADQAHTLANVIALSPFLFQAVAAMRDSGLLAAIYAAGRKGLSVADGAGASGLSEYGVEVLRDMGRSVGLFKDTDDALLRATPMVHFFLHDKSIDVNFRFSQHFAWDGLPRTRESLETREPLGLRSHGPWDNLYRFLSVLPSPAKEAWFGFDHFYSDSAFEPALDLLMDTPPRVLLDIGGNTGRFARRYLAREGSGRIVLQDLPEQLAVADRELTAAGLSGRYGLHACDALDLGNPFFEGADAAWMSQFICCFSPEQLVPILRRTAEALPPGAPIYILDTFWDRQTQPSGSFSLHAASLYFAVFASGDGKMYAAKELIRCADLAGLELTGDHGPIGEAHTLLVFRRRAA